MKINFLGVGEAFDSDLTTTSIAIESSGKVLLVDAGYSAPSPVFKKYPDAESIDYIYFTHWHADHLFGLPAILTRWWEENRKKELVIIGQSGTEKFVKDLLDLAYPGVSWDYAGKFTDKIGQKPDASEGGLRKPHFKISFVEAEISTNIGPFALFFAPTTHVRKNLAVRVNVSENNLSKSFGFSGDGDFTDQSRELFRNIDFLAHETYLLNDKILGHGCVEDAIHTAEQVQVKKLALIHINRNTRKNEMDKIQKMMQQAKTEIIVPQPGELYEI